MQNTQHTCLNEIFLTTSGRLLGFTDKTSSVFYGAIMHNPFVPKPKGLEVTAHLLEKFDAATVNAQCCATDASLDGDLPEEAIASEQVRILREARECLVERAENGHEFNSSDRELIRRAIPVLKANTFT
jgi:hypothetical protein